MTREPETEAEDVLDREPYFREREHVEERPGVRSWWRCIPISEARLWEARAQQATATDLDAIILTLGRLEVPPTIRGVRYSGWLDGVAAAITVLRRLAAGPQDSEPQP